MGFSTSGKSKRLAAAVEVLLVDVSGNPIDEISQLAIHEVGVGGVRRLEGARPGSVEVDRVREDEARGRVDVVGADELPDLPDEETVLICTGSQGDAKDASSLCVFTTCSPVLL